MIYKRVTGDEGYFNTQLIYAETVKGVKSSARTTRLVQIDQDGYNRKELTDGKELIFGARYSGDGKLIAFNAYNDKGKGVLGKSAHAYVMKLNRKSRDLIISENTMQNLINMNKGNPVQMTYAPRFSPDGRHAVLAVIIDGKSAIYRFDFETRKLIQLTKHACIDTSPCFSHDGDHIVFTSNRDGREAIYIMDFDGKNQKRISHAEGKYSQPVCSPRGDYIAFSKQTGGQFYIGVMKFDGSGERYITSGYLVEAPCWTSNGRYIAYSCQAGPGAPNKIAIVDLTGKFTRIVETQGDATYPAWSPAVSE
jgi:TolB protein